VKLLRKTAILAAAMASLAALAVAGGGAASASGGEQINNMGLVVGGPAAPCLTAHTSDAGITQEQCAFAANQQWVYLGTPSQNNPIQIQNVGTGQCMDATAFSDAAPVVQVSCATQAIGSYWNRNNAAFNDPHQGYTFKSNFANYCLDLENGWSSVGVSMQVWQCNPRTRNQDWDVFGLAF
jgi:hypothetical protein